MFIQYLDFLSPPISLYFNKKRTHTSKISGLIGIIMILGCFSYSFILFYSIINHTNFISLIYKKFEWEPGFFEMNTTELFHFFQIFSSESGGYFDKYEPKYIRIYLTYVHNNLEQSQLHNYDHWVFDECREGIDNKDMSKDLFQNIANFTNAACIRYYYNSEENVYYSLEEKGFIWPHFEFGISRRDNVFLTTILEKCSNDSVLTRILGDCESIESIEEYVKRYFGFYIYLIDTSVDTSNYANPFQKYFQIISTGIGNSKTFVENYIHFSPLRVRTKVGEIFGEYEDINSFFFDFNRKGTAESFDRILLKNYYLMQNNINIYERRYKGVFDILSSIGGASQLLFFACSIINYIYNKYIIIMDTNKFFCQIYKESHNEKIINFRKIIDPFEKIKKYFGINDNKENSVKKSVLSVNYDVYNPFKKKENESKSEYNAKKKIDKKTNFSKVKESQILKNNFFKSSINEPFQKNEIINYVNSSNVSNENLDFSNKPINNINIEKRLDSIDILKEKNISSSHNNDLISNLNNITANNHKKNKIESNNKNIYGPPKKQKSVKFRENVKENKIKKDKDFAETVNGNQSVKTNNFEEVLKIQKLNKDMVKKSKYFEKEFSLFYFIIYGCFNNKKKEEFKNLYSLISFRKKILSENFIFRQHIINLLLGKKCGINPNEIKKLI